MRTTLLLAIVAAAVAVAVSVVSSVDVSALTVEPKLVVGIHDMCWGRDVGFKIKFYYNNTGDEAIALLAGSAENFVTLGRTCFKENGIRQCVSYQPQNSVFFPGYHVAFEEHPCADQVENDGAAWQVRYNGVTSLALVPKTIRTACPVQPSVADDLASAAKALKAMVLG